MLKEKIKESEGAFSQKQCRWRNVVFRNDGATSYGVGLWPSEQEAALQLQTTLDKLFSGAANIKHPDSDVVITKENYGWNMQIPILGND